MIIFLAGLQTVQPELYEVASIDGAGAVRKLLSITLPSIRPVTVFVLITSLVEAFKTFEQVNIMTKGGPMMRTSTIVYQIYLRAFEDFQMGYAATQSIALLLIVLSVTLINFKAIIRGAS
jgi:ABC-type sugar transport system permease subunit